MFKLILILLFFNLTILKNLVASETMVGMKKARAMIDQSLKLDSLEGVSIELGEIEIKFQEVLSSQLSFCKKNLVELNNYFIKEVEGEIDVKQVKKDCLLSLRKWHITTEKKLFKLKRRELKKTMEKSLAKLREIEEQRIKDVAQSYKALF